MNDAGNISRDSAWHGPLAGRWRDLGHRLMLRGRVAEAFEELYRCYTEPHRRYHTIEHIAACMAILDDVAYLAADSTRVEAALFFHDAVYRIGDPANEALSAELARRVLGELGCAAHAIDGIAELVMATDHRTPPATPDGRLTADIDLAILGQPPAAYDRYARAIREEAALPAEEFTRRRAEFLRMMLGKPALFHTEALRARYEAAARGNMEREVGAVKIRNSKLE